FILPPDILSRIGYGKETIAPYLTIDKNPEFIRINGTLRGPNPLGVYALMAISLLGAFVLSKEMRHQTKSVGLVMAGAILMVTPAVLWASYSRSALVAAVISAAIVLFVALSQRFRPRLLLALMVVPFIVGGGVLLAAKDTSFVQHVVLHRDPADPV
ncbi:hypothetical protein CYG49_00020, partial [Candidatus Saccharibacteria bacterium]